MVEETWVTLIQGAAAGEREARSIFSRRYEPAVRAYVAVRWRGTPWIDRLDDAVQEVFVECFKGGGVLESFDPSREGGFRAFLYGAARNVALRFERDGTARNRREAAVATAHLEGIASSDASLATVFDREFASSIMQQARERMEQLALVKGANARRRVELLRLRFEDDLPIRDIAIRWADDPARLHREYRKAREEFQRCLRQVVAYHGIGDGELTHMFAVLGS